jgi:hypothetical protein
MQNPTIFEAKGGNEAVIIYKKRKIEYHFDGYSNA